MNDELSPQARSILDSASGGDDPTGADKKRVRRAVLATIGGGAALASSTAASSTAAAATAGGGLFGGGAVALKVGAAIALVGVVTTAAIVRPWEPVEPASIAAPMASEPAPVPDLMPPVAIPEPEAVGQEAVVQEVDEPVAEPLPEVDRARAVPAFVPRSASAPQPNPGVAEDAEEAAPSSLANELALLRAAQRARAAGDPGSALTHLAEHAERFPQGMLAAERRVTRVLSLCDLGRTDEAAQLAGPILSEPASPYARRLAASCVGQ